MKHFISAVGLLALAGGVAQADVVQVRVTVQNLAAPSGVAISPLTVAFHNGSWDAFNTGAAASTGVQNIAESGNGAAYLTAFTGANPQGVSGVVPATVNAFGPGIYLPGGSGSLVFTLDTSTNRYFSYGAMVVPSNDMFIGNDNPIGFALFDAAGNFLNPIITLHGGSVWDAGTEVNAPFGAAFLAGQNGGAHTAENGLITTSAGFSPYANLLTAAGYSFADLPGADTPIARITFEIVPTPGAALGLAGLATLRRRKR
jgi:hypothetical protein